MKRLIVFCIFCAVLAAVLFSFGTELSYASKKVTADKKWEYYASDEEGSEYSYNPKNLERLPGNIVRVWVKALYSEKNLKRKEGSFLWEIDCSKKSWRGIEARLINRDGTKDNLTKSSDWSVIPSESTAASLYEIVCKQGKRAK